MKNISKKSKIKVLLPLLTIVLLVACSNAKISDTSPLNYDSDSMAGMPCHQMGDVWMGDCQFDDQGNIIEDSDSHSMMSTDADDEFSRNTKNLPDAKPSEIVELKDGDVYKMTAGLVKQEIGNRTIKRLAYNNQIPGPLLKVDQGAKITLEFTNSLDVETTLHSHGLRLDNKFDGVPEVTQETIKPEESFTYQLKFPDAGIYWYHPHIREDYTQELGLYGNMIVSPTEQDYWAPVDREVNWILDDMLVNNQEPTSYHGQTDYSLMGRFGNIMLLNNEEQYTLDAKKGEIIRFGESARLCKGRG